MADGMASLATVLPGAVIGASPSSTRPPTGHRAPVGRHRATHGVPVVSASAFMGRTPAVVRSSLGHDRRPDRYCRPANPSRRASVQTGGRQGRHRRGGQRRPHRQPARVVDVVRDPTRSLDQPFRPWSVSRLYVALKGSASALSALEPTALMDRRTLARRREARSVTSRGRGRITRVQDSGSRPRDEAERQTYAVWSSSGVGRCEERDHVGGCADLAADDVSGWPHSPSLPQMRRTRSSGGPDRRVTAHDEELPWEQCIG